MYLLQKRGIMLIKRKDTYQVDTEQEAVQLIEDAKKSIEFELKKYTNQKKEIKKTGDEFYIVTLEKDVPQRIRMFVWIEGQDIDCNDNLSVTDLTLSIELAGSSKKGD